MEPFDSSKIKAKTSFRRRLIIVSMFAIGLILTAFAARELLLGLHDDVAAQTEYAQLRQMGTAMFIEYIPGLTEPESESNSAGYEEYISPQEQIEALLLSLTEINPHFIGWISIPGTSVDYPVVLGPDNFLYLHTTFNGIRNPAGAIFMDYRGTAGFNAPVSLIHGHNMRDGSMFSSLTDYLDQEFMNRYPEIIIVTADGERLVYNIFAVRRTDAWDDVYTFDFNDYEAAEKLFGATDTNRILILSTCMGGSDRNARLLVLAALN